MAYSTLMNLHLLTVIPCFFIGAYLLMARKGSSIHKGLGKVYMGLMMTTAIITLLMPSQVGPRFLGHFGWTCQMTCQHVAGILVRCVTTSMTEET